MTIFRRLRLQSAMEYLMTYGWAILIIAIVLGVLYYLGVFGGATTAPRAQAGNCQVFRPNGPGTSYDAGLSGTCNNELPEYVAILGSQPSRVTIGNPSNLNLGSAITMSVWIMPTSELSNNRGTLIAACPVIGTTCTSYDLYLRYSPGNDIGTQFTTSNNRIYNIITGTISYGSWQQLAVTFDGSTLKLYINGTLVSSTASSAGLTRVYGNVIIGAVNGYGTNSSITDVQIYNTSLSANEINALYLEGVGGAPINPAYVVGWWPLNGNPNDYSGNQDNGAATAVSYTSSWTSGYTQP